MRSGGATKSGPPDLVTLATKSTIAFFAAPSFQDGSGSVSAACPTLASRAARTTVTPIRCARFMIVLRPDTGGSAAEPPRLLLPLRQPVLALRRQVVGVLLQAIVEAAAAGCHGVTELHDVVAAGCRHGA